MVSFFRKRTLFFIILWFVLLSVIFTWPLVTHLTHEIAGDIGDNIYFIWMIGWVKKALFQIHANPLDVWFLNYPEGWNLARTEMAPAQLALALPFSLIGGETFGYNMAMLLSFILAGTMMFGWVRHLSGSASAGWVGGTVFACLPYWHSHFLAGHLNLCGIQWIPLFFWGWFDMLRPGTGEFRKKSAILAALGLGLTAFCSQYYVFMLIFVAAIQGILLILPNRISQLKDIAFWKTFGLFLLITVPLLILAELPFLTLASSGGMPDRDWGSASLYSASPTDFLLPATTHFIFGKWVGSHFHRDLWIEATLYVGIISLILYLYGMVRKKKEQNWIWSALTIGIVCAVILAMGTDLHWNEQPVIISLPRFLQNILQKDSARIYLPGLILYKYFPFFGKMRALMRFGLFALVFIACGAGLGAKALLNNARNHTTLISVLLIALIILDFAPRPIDRFSEIKPRPVDLWLSERPETGSVMNIPFELNDDQAATYYTLYNNKPFIGGFFNAFPPSQYRSIQGIMDTFPSTESLEKARELKVDFFLFDLEALDSLIGQNSTARWQTLEELKNQCRENGLVELATFDNLSVYGFKEDDENK